MNELRNRGVADILIAVVDGLKGFPKAITAAFPETLVQTCIVHLVRHSMSFCNWKDRKAVAADLRRIYEAPTAELAADQLDAFEAIWGGKYPSVAPAWRRAKVAKVPPAQQVESHRRVGKRSFRSLPLLRRSGKSFTPPIA